VTRSQAATVPFMLPVAMVPPSLLKHMEMTLDVCPARGGESHPPFTVSAMYAAPQLPPIASFFPSGLTAIAWST